MLHVYKIILTILEEYKIFFAGIMLSSFRVMHPHFIHVRILLYYLGEGNNGKMVKQPFCKELGEKLIEGPTSRQINNNNDTYVVQYKNTGIHKSNIREAPRDF